MTHFFTSWVYGGSLAGLLLLGLMPAFAPGWSLALVLVFLHLPGYMLHQLEEHADDRFRRFFNAIMGGGREVLTPAAVFVVNVPGVWGVNLASILLAARVDLGWGLIGVYLTLVNAVVHVAQAARMRRYNPGLATAVGMFLPLAVVSLFVLIPAATPTQHVVGLVAAVAFHAAIIVHARRRRAKLERAA